MPPRKAGKAAARAAACLLSWLAIASPAAPATLALQRLDVSRLPEVTCYFTVVDGRGDSLLGLLADDFQLRVDGLEWKIARLSSAIDGGAYLAVALLLDGSGSMKPHLGQARKAAVAFSERTSRLDQLAVFSCNEALTVHQDFSPDRARVQQALAAVQARGNTALRDALAAVLARFQTVPAPRRALVALTDGHDNRSRAGVDDIIGLAAAAGVPLYTVGLGPGSDDEGLRRLAKGTGGEFFKAAEAGDLLALYQSIGEHLGGQYILQFDLGMDGDGKWHEMELALRSAGEKAEGVAQKFLAAVSPTLAPSAMASMQTHADLRQRSGQALPGALLGLLAGLLLLGLLKLLRPALPFFSWASLALLVSLALLGAVVAVLRNWL